MTEALPPALAPFVGFAGVLRANGFSVAPEQTQGFIAAVGLLGPRSIRDVHRAAVALLAPPPEQREVFDALFRMVFLGQTLAAPAPADPDEEELQAFDDRDGAMEPPEADEEREAGAEATGAEKLTMRVFAGTGESETLRRFQREASRTLPRRASRRWRTARAGASADFRRALREAVRRDGEVVSLPMLSRRTRQRRILLLVDVSGSMKGSTEAQLRFAHALMRSAERLEVFTVGTRLTRVTRALKARSRDQALALASTMVADWDGGTRLGDALQAFLSVPRFASFARGALVVVLSDGLERGDPAALIDAVARLRRLAWAILWLTPLAADASYVPQTEALVAILPDLSRLGSAAGTGDLCREVLDFSRRAA